MKRATRLGRNAGAALLAYAFALGRAAAADDHAAHSLPPAPPPRFEAPAAGSYQLPAIDRVGQHQLLGTSGAAEPLIALKDGELALISFVYLQCGEACPLSTAMLHRLDGELAKDPALARRVELVTVSFDPQRDTPQQMRALREKLAPKGRWRFLTAANESALRPVLADFGQDAVWIPGEANAPDALRHVLKVFVVDANGAVRQIYSTGFLDTRLVLADLRTLLTPAT
ncbi:MAG TPA: SCO family protein [Myxococcota bacterium]|nr:SCO family protein [Myxococcota bacterium]